MKRLFFITVAAAAAVTSCNKRAPKAIEVQARPTGNDSSADAKSRRNAPVDDTLSNNATGLDAPLDAPLDTPLGSQSNPDPLASPTPGSDPYDPSAGDPTSTRGGLGTLNGSSNTATGANAPTDLSVQEVARLFGITDEQASAGKAYVNGLNGEAPWNGALDEPAANNSWRLKQPAFSGVVTGVPGATGATGQLGNSGVFGQNLGTGQTGNNSGLPGQGVGNGLPQNGQQAGTATENVFRIAAGTGDQNWNSQANPIRGRVGFPLTIYNDDTVVHQIHMGPDTSQSFEHGGEIQPGDSAIYTPQQAFTGITYDHLTNQNLGRPNQIFLQVN